MHAKHGLVGLLEVESTLAFDLELRGDKVGLDALTLVLILLLLLLEVVVNLLDLDVVKSLRASQLAFVESRVHSAALSKVFDVLGFNGEKPLVSLVPEGLDGHPVVADSMLQEAVHVHIVDVELGVGHSD